MGRELGRVAHMVRVGSLLQFFLTQHWKSADSAGGDSRIFKIGKLPVNPFGEVLHRPENNGDAAERTAKLDLTLLLSK